MKHTFRLLTLFFCTLAIFVSSSSFAQETNQEETSETLTGEGSEFLILSELAFGVGFPGYQLYNANVGFQKDSFGINFRGSITGLGPYLSLSGRYYTPIPIPVPTFISLGAGYFSGSPTGLATVGAQIPFGISSPFRATIEAGLSVAPGFNGEIEYLPTASVTIGYIFFVDTTPLTAEVIRERELAASRPAGCVPTEPDKSLLGTAFSNKLDGELARAKVRYAGVYSLNGSSYTKTSEDTNEAGDQVTWKGTWEATVTEVLTGKQSSGGGSFKVDFGWNGCGWSVSYSL